MEELIERIFGRNVAKSKIDEVFETLFMQQPLNEEAETEDVEDEIIMDIIVELMRSSYGVRKRKSIEKRVHFWESPWGLMILDPNVEDPRTRAGKKFRRRFRVPFPLFQVLVKEFEEKNIFGLKIKSSIPIEAKILACLRILGRDACADDICELSHDIIGESSMYHILKKFVQGVVDHLYPSVVKFATSDSDYLKEVLLTYAKIGCPGALGSMDCTRVKWSMCPEGLRWHCTGKEGFPTLVFLVIVDHNRRVQYVSHFFFGGCNDQTIVNNDDQGLKVTHGSLDHVKYAMFDGYGERVTCMGAYLITDGGFGEFIGFIHPDKFRFTREGILWSEWLESVRKDVECFFGILKSRFRFFRNGIRYHKPKFIEAAFKCCCCLHNMILMFDKVASGLEAVWEKVDWSALDPNANDDDEYSDSEDNIVDGEEDEEDVEIMSMNSYPETQLAVDLNQTEEPSRQRYTQQVVEYKHDTEPQHVLKDALEISFTVQWIKNKLLWPKAMFEHKKPISSPFTRALMEMKRALYVKQSLLFTKNYNGDYNNSVGQGLFSSLGYKVDDLIVTYTGILRTQTAYMALCEKEPIRRNYSIAISEHGDVLDCYDDYLAGKCLASFANSYKNTFNRATQQRSAPNARIVVNVQKKTCSIRAGVKTPTRFFSSTNFTIPPHTEIIVDYGDSFVGL